MNPETVNLDRYLARNIMERGWLEEFADNLEKQAKTTEKDISKEEKEAVKV